MEEGRKWKLRADSSRSEAEFQEQSLLLQKETGLSPITIRVCMLRGLNSAQAIHDYLSPRFENLKNPFQIQDMALAVQRIGEAREKNQKIRIFGDYDVDGTCGAALLSWVFREMGFESDARQPDRFKDGYGLNVGAVEAAVRDQVQVLVTVDCGITSFDATQRARELGLDVIVVDHHQVDPVKGVPPAVAVLNPQRKDCESALRQLCGCGLAFYFSMALRAHGRKNGWFVSIPEPNLKQHLDLVVMATAADMVPLVGDNHILVRYGLEVLKHSKKPGVQALLQAAGLSSREISPSHLGFVLGPRINASGRMESASLALELLTTQDVDRAQVLASELESLNQERARIQNEIWDQVRVRVEKGIAEGKFKYGVVVADSNWHEGVVGIVASRVTETFQRPAAVISMREDFGKGSVRSFGGKDILAALRECAPQLRSFGGHRFAAGLSVNLDQVDALAQAFDQALEKIHEDGTSSLLWIEGNCSMDDLSVKGIQELERLGPFGPGNPEPVFAMKASVRGQRILKGRHLKLSLGQARGAFPAIGSSMDAIWFHGAERKDVAASLEALVGSQEAKEWAGVPELNRFRGQVTPTLRVKDWRRAGE